ncbi:hypothetical protein [Planctomicrobium piriforme]|uniref:Dolichyl-phosphate-mannose-protein mannosyltransferase n=1 Tax=Planctomicrobium piriforme TaxID=1576369 RepID=A0A1I3PX40_9PLAN|nr:hypothetical protein [Planctomicrobium piriforme]SFJ25496.1 hypothetical protein SAMN05421753_11751 [Planctomicrobium piriforme]
MESSSLPDASLVPRWRVAEWVTALLLTGSIVAQMVYRTLIVGPLWRDECGALQLARLPEIRDVWQNFPHEAFPFAFPMVLRAYTGLFGDGDASLRLFGLGVGLLIVAALWLNGWMVHRGPPLLALVLTGMNTHLLTYGMAVRGYGLGVAGIVLALTWLDRTRRFPTRSNTLLATVACVLAVQFLLFNSFLLLAVGSAAIFTAALRREWSTAARLTAICAAAAISLVPYVPGYLGARQWNSLCQSETSLGEIWGALCVTLRAPQWHLAWLWHLLVIGTLGASLLKLVLIRKRNLSGLQDSLRFVFQSIAYSIAVYFVFLLFLRYDTGPWHYLALLAVLACLLDMAFPLLCSWSSWHWLRVVCVLLLGVILSWQNLPGLRIRYSNIDAVAAVLKQQCQPGDLVIVEPWFQGISYKRYQPGICEWMIVPPIGPLEHHRYDLMKQAMQSAAPLAPVLSKIETTLRSGNRVWHLSALHFREEPEPVPLLPACGPVASHVEHGDYIINWHRHLVRFLQEHAISIVDVPVLSPQPIDAREEWRGTRIEGWKGAEPEAGR